MNMQGVHSDETALSGRLLQNLRRLTGHPKLDYRWPLEQIALGTEARILRFSLRSAPPELSGPLVLRVYLPEADSVHVDVEHAAQNALASQGFPAPRVLISTQDGSVLGQPFLIMEYVATQPTFYGRLISRRMRAIITRVRPRPSRRELHMQTLARLHSLDGQALAHAFMIHGVPSDRLRTSVRRELALAQMATWQLEEFQPLLQWLTIHRPPVPGETICHGDPHLGNMMFNGGRVATMIDWGGVGLTHPEADLGAFCGLILCMVSPPAPDEQREIDEDLALYERYRPIRRALVRYYEVEYLWSILVKIAGRERRRIAGERPPPNPCLDDPLTPCRAAAWLEGLVGPEVPVPHVSHLRPTVCA